jgi:hypothetical protein
LNKIKPKMGCHIQCDAEKRLYNVVRKANSKIPTLWSDFVTDVGDRIRTSGKVFAHRGTDLDHFFSFEMALSELFRRN